MTEAKSAPGCRLYLITPEQLDPADFAPRLAEALDAGDVACIQLRLKGVSDDAIRSAAAKLMSICHQREVALLINDRADLAAECGADGVHLGQTDGTIGEARKFLGYDRDIGVTCHNSMDLAFDAGEAGADYVAFGAFYPTGTKQPPTMADPDLLRQWSEIAELPSVAIGGITAENCGPLVEAGADFLAVSSYVWSHPDGPAAAVDALNKAIDTAARN